jgi:hypothetical protein
MSARLLPAMTAPGEQDARGTGLSRLELATESPNALGSLSRATSGSPADALDGTRLCYQPSYHSCPNRASRRLPHLARDSTKALKGAADGIRTHDLLHGKQTL